MAINPVIPEALITASGRSFLGLFWLFLWFVGLIIIFYGNNLRITHRIEKLTPKY